MSYHGNSVAYADMLAIDRWAVGRLQKLIAEVTDAYDNFVFHRVFSLVYNFCTVDMSNIYMDVLKDRMYCDAAGSLSRRSGQTAMYRILDSLVRLLAPVLVHTAEEAWAAMKFKSADVESVHLAGMPTPDDTIDAHIEDEKWSRVMALRDEVLRVLEGLRREQKIGSNQQACVTIYSDDEELNGILNELGLENFAALCIVSEVKLQKGSADRSGSTVVAQKSSHEKCQRCWNYWPSVGSDSKHPDLCSRCVKVISNSG